jgi:hypothetical protein
MQLGGSGGYLYFDSIDTDMYWPSAHVNAIAKDRAPSALPTQAYIELKPTNCAWEDGYMMDSFSTLYLITGDTYWLDKLVAWADKYLSLRDNVVGRTDYLGRLAPAWQVDPTGQKYVYVGCTGNFFQGMMKFARIVRERGLTAYDAKAQTYVEAFEAALQFHSGDWRTWPANTAHTLYLFPKNGVPIPNSSMWNDNPIPPNMGALMAEAQYELHKYYEAVGRTADADAMFAKVTAFANYFKDQLVFNGSGSGTYYTWKYSNYYSTIEDVGHGNFDMRFVARTSTNETNANCSHLPLFNDTHLDRFTQTFLGLFNDVSQIEYDLVDRTGAPGTQSIYYWHLIGRYRMNVYPETLSNAQFKKKKDVPPVPRDFLNFMGIVRSRWGL